MTGRGYNGRFLRAAARIVEVPEVADEGVAALEEDPVGETVAEKAIGFVDGSDGRGR
jgi:hypothetical protein